MSNNNVLSLDKNGWVHGLSGNNVYDHLEQWDIFNMVRVSGEWYHLSISTYESIMNSYYIDSDNGLIYFEDSYKLERMENFVERVYGDTSFSYLIEEFKKFKENI